MVKYFQVINFTYLISNSFGIMHILIRLRDNGHYKLLKIITSMAKRDECIFYSLKIFNIIIYCNKHTEGDIL